MNVVTSNFFNQKSGKRPLERSQAVPLHFIWRYGTRFLQSSLLHLVRFHMPVPGKITSGVKIKDHKRKTSIMGRDDSTRKCSAVVSRLTDRNPHDRQNATVWRHSSKLNPSAERFLDCACLFVSVRGMLGWGGWGGGDDGGVMIREY